jgi:hypothetical protein
MAKIIPRPLSAMSIFPESYQVVSLMVYTCLDNLSSIGCMCRLVFTKVAASFEFSSSNLHISAHHSISSWGSIRFWQEEDRIRGTAIKHITFYTCSGNALGFFFYC